MASYHISAGSSNGSVDPVNETAHASQAVTSDAVAFPAIQAVSTPSLELPDVFSNQQLFSNGSTSSIGEDINGSSTVNAANGSTSIPTSSLSRSNSVSSRSPIRGKQQQRVSAPGDLCEPVCFPYYDSVTSLRDASSPASSSTSTPRMVLELADGTAFQGFSFGAVDKSISGECVFQTGEYLRLSFLLLLIFLYYFFSMMSVSLAPVSSWLCLMTEQL